MARILGSGRMIEETSVQISTLRERWQAERELRYARRNRIRHIDQLLDELEMLNIAEETQLPAELAGRVPRVAGGVGDPVGHRAPGGITVGQSVGAPLDLQGGVMVDL